MHATVSALQEYEVLVPTELLGSFPAPSAVLTTMQLFIHELDEFQDRAGDAYASLAPKIGIDGLRHLVSAAMHRSFRNADSSPIALQKNADAQAFFVVVDAGHYFISTIQVGLVIDRLIRGLHGVVFPGTQVRNPPLRNPVWIHHQAEARSESDWPTGTAVDDTDS